MRLGQNASPYPIRIRPSAGYGVRLRELWRYRDLVLLLTKKNFLVRYKQTLLGPFWAFLYPLASSVLLALTFGGIIHMQTEGVPHIVFYLCSNSLWSYFASCMRGNSNVFTSNAALFGKVYFPRLAVPLANWLMSLLTYAIQAVIVLACVAWFAVRGEVSPLYAWWPVLPLLLAWLGLLGLGIGLIFSSLTIRYRDLGLMLDFGVQLLLYASPVLWPLSLIGSPALRGLLLVNPLAAPVELFRRILLGVGALEPGYLLLSGCVTLAVLALGLALFARAERDFIDTV